MEAFKYEDKVQKIFDETKDKREFGLKKYGEKSFQISEEKFLECELLEHMRQELIDSINYAYAAIIKIDMFDFRF